MDQTGARSGQVSPLASPDALGQERRGKCSVGLNTMFSQLLRLDEREGQRPFPGESEKTQRRRASPTAAPQRRPRATLRNVNGYGLGGLRRRALGTVRDDGDPVASR